MKREVHDERRSEREKFIRSTKRARCSDDANMLPKSIARPSIGSEAFFWTC